MPTMLNFLFEPPWCMSFFCAVENNFLSSSPALASSISMFYWTLLTLSSYCIWSGGRFSDGWGSCDRREKRFNKPNHDIPSTAKTRAKNKACQVRKSSTLLHIFFCLVYLMHPPVCAVAWTKRKFVLEVCLYENFQSSTHQLLNNTVILGCNKDKQRADDLFPIIKERMPSYLMSWVNFLVQDGTNQSTIMRSMLILKDLRSFAHRFLLDL